MKTKLLGITIASLLCASLAEARFYIGIESGFTGATSLGNGGGMYYGKVPLDFLKYAFKTINQTNGVESMTMEPFQGLNIEINFGAENFYLNNYLGFRWGASVGYTHLSQFTQFQKKENWGTTITSSDEQYSFLDVGLSLDAIVNFWNNGSYSAGVFGGVEGEYHYMFDGFYSMHELPKQSFKNLHSFGISGRTGISALLANHHRLDFIAKIPIMISGDNKLYSDASYLAKTSFNVSYKYVF